MKVEIKIETIEGGKQKGTIAVGDKTGDITIYSDSSYDITPGWLETKAISAAGSKGQLRTMIRNAMV